jgi:hypothetical protein
MVTKGGATGANHLPSVTETVIIERMRGERTGFHKTNGIVDVVTVNALDVVAETT